MFLFCKNIKFYSQTRDLPTERTNNSVICKSLNIAIRGIKKA